MTHAVFSLAVIKAHLQVLQVFPACLRVRLGGADLKAHWDQRLKDKETSVIKVLFRVGFMGAAAFPTSLQ